MTDTSVNVPVPVSKEESEQEKMQRTLASLSQTYNCDSVYPFSIKRKGKVDWFCIAQMSGGERDRYLMELQNSAEAKPAADGKSMNFTMRSFDGMSTLLLKFCVYGYDNDKKVSTGELVTQEILKTWPSDLLDSLSLVANDKNVLQGNVSLESLGNGSISQSDGSGGELLSLSSVL